tara:strand:- start:6759 stop:7490 length:732 start_codon:yes stop_codon:yes gene_type:complete
MKYKLTKAEFEALTEEARTEYTLDGETAVLILEGDDAPTAEKIATLEKKREIEAEHRKNAETKLKEADDRAAKHQKDFESAGGNKEAIEKLRTDHAAEIEKLRTERETESAKVRGDRDAALIKEESSKFASGHFVEAPYGSTFIASEMAKRLVVEEVNGSPVVRVQNADGTPSTAALADLQKEFLDNKDFSPIIKAKAGSGGGAIPGQGGGATKKSLSEMSATEEAAFERENPDAYAAAIGKA